MGNIVSIMGTNDEIAHYKYDAWGKCTITENVGGIAALNPFRWKSHYYDNESGLYYIGGRYYSPVMKSFISPCNIDEILYNISVPGNLNAYSIGNPMYFPMNRFNIFTSIPLVPENIGSGGESDFWRFLGSVGRFVGGAIITVGGAILTYTSAPLFLVPGLSIIPQFGITMTMYGAFMTASSWDSQIKEDMDRIGWNPLNSNETAVFNSQKVSFYKSAPVFRYGNTSTTRGGGFSFVVIGIGRGETRLSTVRHEYGHYKQQRLMGLLLYTSIVA